MPTHESEQRRRLSPPAARAAPPASPRLFPQPDPSPQSPSSVTSLCRVLACKVAAPPFVPRRLSDRNGSIKILAAPDAKCGMADIGTFIAQPGRDAAVEVYQGCKIPRNVDHGEEGRLVTIRRG